jgi:hypothetical protein
MTEPAPETGLPIQLPADLAALVQAQAQKAGKTPDEVAIAAIWYYFSVSPGEQNNQHILLQRLSNLEDRLAQLERLVTSAGSSHTASLPADVPGYQLGKQASSYRTNAPDSQARKDIVRAIADVEGVSFNDEDIEDEPDEILYDFLDPEDR